MADIHLLRFPSWRGSTNRGHHPGGKAAVAQAERRLAGPLLMKSEVSIDDDDDKAALTTSSAVERNVEHLHAIVREAACARERLLSPAAPCRVFTVGGDCGVEVLPVSYANMHHPDMIVIWFDAHADLNT